MRAEHPGVSIDPAASTNLAKARFAIEPGGRLAIGPGVVAERQAEGVRFHIEAGGELVVGAGTWLRSEVEPVHLAVYSGARLVIGDDAFLNGCQISAKGSVELGRKCWVGPGSRIYDADQHDLDAERREAIAPVKLGDFVWVASDVTVLKGVEIGSHSVVGARSLVTSSLPPHSLAFGVPAKRHGEVGDRSEVEI